MLKELSLEELGADVDDYNIEIDTFNCNDNEIMLEPKDFNHSELN